MTFKTILFFITLHLQKNDIPTKKEVATSTPLKIKTSSPVLQPKEVAIVTISTKEKTPEVNPETSTIKKDSTINTALNKEKRLEITSQPKAKEVIAFIMALDSKQRPDTGNSTAKRS